MKRYTTPILVAKGDVVGQTQGPFPGSNDPGGVTHVMSVGDVGFNL
jgi:hypothetical protein